MDDPQKIQKIFDKAINHSLKIEEGQLADYIPDLTQVDEQATCAAIQLVDSGQCVTSGQPVDERFTLQSSSKPILLAALLEEVGEEKVFSVVDKEPSGGSFRSIARLESHGPIPANPLINAGAIALCGLLEGSADQRTGKLADWLERCCGVRLPVDKSVLQSELDAGDHNRAIAHLLRANGIITGSIDCVLETYLTLCSTTATVAEAARFPALLAAGGINPDGKRVLSEQTVCCVLAVMATCGMYDESGSHLVRTGLPAKSGVSGYIIASAPGKAGIAIYSPKINEKGSSVRGLHILEILSHQLGLHFAKAPR